MLYEISPGPAGAGFITIEAVETCMEKSLLLGYIIRDLGATTDWPIITDSEADANQKQARDTCDCPTCTAKRKLAKLLNMSVEDVDNHIEKIAKTIIKKAEASADN